MACTNELDGVVSHEPTIASTPWIEELDGDLVDQDATQDTPRVLAAAIPTTWIEELMIPEKEAKSLPPLMKLKLGILSVNTWSCC